MFWDWGLDCRPFDLCHNVATKLRIDGIFFQSTASYDYHLLNGLVYFGFSGIRTGKKFHKIHQFFTFKINWTVKPTEAFIAITWWFVTTTVASIATRGWANAFEFWTNAILQAYATRTIFHCLKHKDEYLLTAMD